MRKLLRGASVLAAWKGAELLSRGYERLIDIGLGLLFIAALFLAASTLDSPNSITRRTAGFLTRALSCWAGVLIFLRVALASWGEPASFLLQLVLWGLIIPLGGYFIVLIRRVTAPNLEEALSRDQRHPILYLRPFALDSTPTAVKENRSWKRTEENYWTGGRAVTFEEVVCCGLASAGPVIAIGRPGEALPPLGAARTYVPDDWQAEVARRVSQCALICLAVGTTPGLIWELNYLVRNCQPPQVLLAIPKNAAWKSFVDLVAVGIFPQGLPTDLPADAVALRFEAAWAPRIVRGPFSFDTFCVTVTDMMMDLRRVK